MAMHITEMNEHFAMSLFKGPGRFEKESWTLLVGMTYPSEYVQAKVGGGGRTTAEKTHILGR
jgi:hypothetical protein